MMLKQGHSYGDSPKGGLASVFGQFPVQNSGFEPPGNIQGKAEPPKQEECQVWWCGEDVGVLL